jgi:nitroimidazol reductase NimA-like FMN-containing flavoprotein (pyridoxamine 5'-phosphate oxidase superfamily)
MTISRFDHPEAGEWVSELSAAECMTLLGTSGLGRLISNVREVIDVFPLNYAVVEGEIILRTAEGSKLVELTIHPEVLFEVDEVGPVSAWSVVVRGRARVLDSAADLARAEAAAIEVLTPVPRSVFVSIDPSSLSGRWFRRVDTVH